jgi:alkylhydroperoxidase family enzyme
MDLDDQLFAQLKNAYTDAQIVELVVTAAAFEMFPRLVDGLRIPMTPAPEPTAGKKV